MCATDFVVKSRTNHICLNLSISSVNMVKFIISPNKVFGDIMVSASPPRPPVDLDDINVDPDDVNALNSKNI